MYSEGHAGFSLLILSLFMLTFGSVGMESILVSIFITIFSSLPDIDLRLRPLVKHRSPVTHSLLAGICFGIVLAIITGYVGCGWSVGFLAGFEGTVLHLLGDIFTYTPIKLLWPFSQRGVSLGFFRSSNFVVNKGMAIFGGLAFVAVILRYWGYF